MTRTGLLAALSIFLVSLQGTTSDNATTMFPTSMDPKQLDEIHKCIAQLALDGVGFAFHPRAILTSTYVGDLKDARDMELKYEIAEHPTVPSIMVFALRREWVNCHCPVPNYLLRINDEFYDYLLNGTELLTGVGRPRFSSGYDKIVPVEFKLTRVCEGVHRQLLVTKNQMWFCTDPEKNHLVSGSPIFRGEDRQLIGIYHKRENTVYRIDALNTWMQTAAYDIAWKWYDECAQAVFKKFLEADRQGLRVVRRCARRLRQFMNLNDDNLLPF